MYGLEASGLKSALSKFRSQNCDAAWIKHYQTLTNVSDVCDRLLQSLSAANVDVSPFEQPTIELRGSDALFNSDALRILLHERYGASYVHDISALKEAIDEKNDSIIEAVARYGALQSLPNAQMMLMKSWKAYMETRCLMYWDKSTSAVSHDRGAIMQKRASEASFDGDVDDTSMHWGDRTSRRLIVELLHTIKTVVYSNKDAGLALDAVGQQHVLEATEMFVSMLHFRLYERAPGEVATRRPMKAVSSRMPLVGSGDSDSGPGLIDLLREILLICDGVLSREPLPELRLTLFTAVLILLQATGNYRDARESARDLQALRLKFLPHILSVLKTLSSGESIFKVSLALLDLIVSHSERYVRTYEANDDLLALIANAQYMFFNSLYAHLKTLSDRAAKRFADHRAMCRFLVSNNLHMLQVRLSTVYSEGKQSDEVVLEQLKRSLGYEMLATSGATSDMKEENVAWLKKKRFRDGARADSSTHAPSRAAYQGYGLSEILLDHGIASVDELSRMNDDMLKRIGVYRAADRRKLLAAVVPKKGVKRAKREQQNIVASREQGKKWAAERDEELSNVESILRLLLSVARYAGCVGSTSASKVVSQGIVRIIVQNNLIKAASRDACDTPVAARGYTIQGGRCGAHRAWCLSLQLVAALLKAQGAEQRIVDQTLDFMAAFRGMLISGLTHVDKNPTTLASMEEATQISSLLRELSAHAQRWRLRPSLFEPFIELASRLMHGLIMGGDKGRKIPMLEEFAYLCKSKRAAKGVPRLCIQVRPVAMSELTDNAKEATMTTLDVIASPKAVSGTESAPSGASVVTKFHVKIEMAICGALKHLMCMFCSRG